ncbi:TetR/AcrR family transcriptional regulator [Methylobacterium oryzihabitans]|uniref:TetR family transcriptional regulator n=1 Tax=Methylobacterium oryzihabitans TaxID=2499852 RepID=A0A3S2YXR0_9HYPH|nr:TetR/AcrR family transcriptional regulator [Methylobacterium oryzihabitans]RVU21717.1 TetR family transcriptional regulator [Methylobacterium oryzihabitans]
MDTDTPALAAPETDKRRQILDGAREVFLAAGFDGASMGAIAKAAGVSKGTLYVYFDSKEALFEALTLEEKRGLAENLFRLDHGDSDVPAVLRRLGLSLLDAMVRPDHVAAVRMVIGASDKFPRFGRAFYEAGPVQGRARLRAYLDAQVAAGRLRPMDSDLAARHFLDLCAATTMRRLLFAVGGLPTEAEREYWVGEAVRVFLAGYGTET